MSLHDDWTQYAEDKLPIDAPEAHVIAVKRAYYAGAQAAALRVRAIGHPDPILAEVSQFGRTVGTKLEAAR